MPSLRVTSRALVHDRKTDTLLLVRSEGADFWCAPGGGLENGESLAECAVRETLEETGLAVRTGRLVFTQTLNVSETRTLYAESLFLAEPTHGVAIPESHEDPDGSVVEARWFRCRELSGILVLPEAIAWRFGRAVPKHHEHLGHFVEL